MFFKTIECNFLLTFVDLCINNCQTLFEIFFRQASGALCNIFNAGAAQKDGGCVAANRWSLVLQVHCSKNKRLMHEDKSMSTVPLKQLSEPANVKLTVSAAPCKQMSEPADIHAVQSQPCPRAAQTPRKSLSSIAECARQDSIIPVASPPPSPVAPSSPTPQPSLDVEPSPVPSRSLPANNVVVGSLDGTFVLVVDRRVALPGLEGRFRVLGVRLLGDNYSGVLRELNRQIYLFQD